VSIFYFCQFYLSLFANSVSHIIYQLFVPLPPRHFVLFLLLDICENNCNNDLISVAPGAELQGHLQLFLCSIVYTNLYDGDDDQEA